VISVPNTELNTNTFCLAVNFDQSLLTPHKLFQSIADMILELQALDKSLIDCIDSELEPVFILDEVENGSIKMWLSQMIKSIPDDAIRNLDAKKILGEFLVKGKHKILKKLAESQEIKTEEQIQPLMQEISILAAQYNISILGIERDIDPVNLLKSMDAISKTANELPPGSDFMYDIGNDPLKIGKGFRVPPNYIKEILEYNKITNLMDMIIKVKKPDYLGNSKWEFRYANRQILCDFDDKKWLSDFHSRKIDVRPGDSLKVKMEICVSYDKNNEALAERYAIKEVLDVIKAVSLLLFTGGVF
jgi:hypothetical protein